MAKAKPTPAAVDPSVAVDPNAATNAPATTETVNPAIPSAKDEAKATAKAEREARLEALKAEGKNYTGSMLALADKVKQGLYVKSATGQLRSNDELAVALDGVGPSDVVRIGLDMLKLEDNPYAKLNVGQQSMNLRNRMRGAIKKEVFKITDIAAYIARNNIHVVTAEAMAAEAKAKADKKEANTKAMADKKAEAEKLAASKAEAAKTAIKPEKKAKADTAAAA